MDLLTAIERASSVEALRDACNEVVAEILALEADGEEGALEAARELSRAYGQLSQELPLFGGEAPPDTRGVWSWSPTHLLVGEMGQLQVVPRPVDPARELDDERLEGLSAEREDIEPLRALLAAVEGGSEGALDRLKAIQENRNDGDPTTGWRSFL